MLAQSQIRSFLPANRHELLARRRKLLSRSGLMTVSEVQQVRELEFEYQSLCAAEARDWRLRELKKLAAQPDGIFKEVRRREINGCAFRIESGQWINLKLGSICRQPDNPINLGLLAEVIPLIFRERSPSQYATQFGTLLQRSSKELRKEALSYFARLQQLENGNTKQRPATVEWLDGEKAVCRFEHPQKERYGWVEREFDRHTLPEGIEEGESFDLEIDVDEDGRPLEYRPVKNGPRRPAQRYEIGMEEPVLPEDWDNAGAVAAYEEALGRYVDARTAAAQRRREVNGY